MPIILPIPTPAMAMLRCRETSNRTDSIGEIVAVSTAGDDAIYVCLQYVGVDTTNPRYEVRSESSEYDPLTMAAIRNLRRLVSSIENGDVLPVSSPREMDELNRIVNSRGLPQDRASWVHRLSQDIADLID